MLLRSESFSQIELQKGDSLNMNAVLGMIYMFAGDFTPQGYTPCDGRLLKVSQNVPLFSLLGTTYGGDGTNTFGIPKLSAPMPGISYIMATVGDYPSRS